MPKKEVTKEQYAQALDQHKDEVYHIALKGWQMTNIFRQAKQLLDTKRGDEMSEEELQLINTAIIPLMVKADGVFPEDITIGEGLDELAKMVEGKQSNGPRSQSPSQSNTGLG